MRTVAFIPARIGSKRIERKNMRLVNGCSLLVRAIMSAAPASETVVSTDDFNAAGVAEHIGTRVHHRPAHLATDDARVESAIAHWLTEGHTPDVIAVLQPTSPLRTAVHVREALALMERTKADTCVSVCVSHTHHFASALRPFLMHTMRVNRDVEVGELVTTADGAVDTEECFAWTSPRSPRIVAARSDPSPFLDPGSWTIASRTQDLAPIAHETGAIYAVRREHFQRHGLHGGRSVAYVMDALDSVDVDEPRDLYLAAIYESVRRDEGTGRDAEWWCGMAKDGIDT